jgi:signal transduction histidine kinase
VSFFGRKNTRMWSLNEYPKRSLWLRIFCLLVWMLSQVSPQVCGMDEPQASPSSIVPHKRVLILYTHRQFSPVNSQWHTGIIEAVRKGYSGPVDFDVEYIDPVLNSDREYLDAWVKLMQSRYQGREPDVIMPVYFPAFTFMIANRATMFPKSPIVFCAVPTGFAKSQSSHLSVTGVGIPLEVGDILDTMRKVNPEMKQLVLLSGNSAMDDWFRRVVIKIASKNWPDIGQIDLQGAPVEHARTYLSGLDNQSGVLLLSVDVDRYGNRYSTGDYLKQIADDSPVPIFGCSDSVLGHGILGGELSSPSEQGAIAGGLVARILNGESADDIPEVFDRTTRKIFDAQVMERYGISESRLPKGSQVVNRRPTIWSQYGKYLAIGLASIVAQSAIIVSLLVNRYRRIRAENDARALAGQILTAVEDERSYLARELHDDLSQRLAAVTIETGALVNRVEGGKGVEGDAFTGALGKVKGQLIGICDDLHRMSHRMHPSVLDDFGLPDALRTECVELSARSGIPIDYVGPIDFEEIPKEMALCLYRIAQEALWNAVKYSSSDRIYVQLTSDSEFVYLEIKDNGVGFDLNAKSPKKGLGLASMRERVRLVGGTFKLQASPGAGVSIAVIVPVPETDTLNIPTSDFPNTRSSKLGLLGSEQSRGDENTVGVMNTREVRK